MKQKFNFKTIFFACLMLIVNYAGAVSVNIGAGALTSGTNQNGNPIYRSTGTSSFHHSKSIHLITAAQMSSASITSGRLIDSFGFFKTTTFGVSGSNNWTINVYMKNSSATALTSGTSWSTMISGATLVYTRTNITSGSMPGAGYWMWPCAPSFSYTGGAVEVYVEWFPTGTVTSPFTGGAFQWQYSSASSVQAMGTSSGSVIPGTQAAWTTVSFSYNCRISHVAPVPCSGTPAPGNTISSAGTTICPGASTTLSLQNFTSGSGVTYQWNANGSPIGGATSSTYVASPTSTTSYTCDVTCSGNTGTSNGISVSVSSPTSVTLGSPWNEGFESVGIGANTFPACWINTNGAGSWNTAASIDGINPRTGSRLIYRQWSTNGTFSTQAFNLTAGNTYEFKFYYTESRGDQTGNWNITAKVGTTSSYAAMATTLGSISNPAGTAYKEAKYNFVAPTTGTYYFGISCSESTGSPWYMVFDDFSVTQLNACSGTPTMGTLSASANPVCIGTSSTISISNAATLNSLSGLTFQWDTAVDVAGSPGTFVPKAGATAITYVANQSAKTWYRLNATCSGNTGTSAPLAINMAPPTSCYCTPVYTSGTSAGDLISRIQITGTTLDNNSGFTAGTPSYVDYSGSALPNRTATLQPATSYNLVISTGEWGDQNYAAWIDYNDDGIFSTPSERIGFTPTRIGSGLTTGQVNATGTFIISLSCTPPAGVHRMRIRGVYSTTNMAAAITPCTSETWGETEDYNITIAPAAPCIPAGSLNTAQVGSNVDTLRWFKNCANTNNYDFQYGLAGFTLGAGTIVTNVNAPDSTYIITGLSSNSTYDVVYRTNCGGGQTSGWSPRYTFTTLPSCFPPTGVTPGTPTGTTCSVSWTANPLNPTSTYRYFVNTTGIPPSTADTGIGNATTSVNLTGLTQTTQYFIWVKSNCGGGDFSAWTSSATFTTIPCIPVYTSGTSAGDLISRVQIVGTTLNNNTGFTAGTPSYVNYYNSALASQTALLQPSTNYDLIISTGEWGDQNYAAWIDYNDDGVFSTPSERIGFTATRIGSGVTTGVVNATGTFTISLACTPPPGPHRMRIRGVYSTTNIGSTIDPCNSQSWGETEDYKITIAPPNSCPSAGLLSASNATANSVDLTWAVGCATATAWDFEYGPAGFVIGTGTRISNVSATTAHTLTGLLSGVNYDVVMRASCGPTIKSFWSNRVNFKTTCLPPSGQVTLNVTNNSILKTWTPGRAEPSWDVFVSTSSTPPANTAVGTFENVTSRPFNITGRSAGLLYYTWVRAQCHSQDSSVWTSAFDTSRTLLVAPDTLNFQVNPNVIAFKNSTTIGITPSGRPGCGTTVADDDKFFLLTKPAGVTSMYVVVGGSANFDPAFEVMSGGFPAYTSLACVNQNSNTLGATESYLIEGLPSAVSYYTIRVYDARTGFGSGVFAIAAYSTKYNVSNIVPCNSISSSNNTGQVANSTTIRTSYDNGVYGGGTVTNLTAIPPVGPNLVYYTGTTAFAPFTAGAPLPSCGTTSATPKRIFYSFIAPTVGGVSVEIRTNYTSTSASTILEAMSATGVPCPTTFNLIKCSTTGILSLTAADLAPFAGQLIYVQLTQNSASDNGISYLMSLQGNAPAITADSANNNGFRVVLPSTPPTGLAKYRLYWRSTGSTGFSFTDVPATATSHKLTNLNSGISYDVWVGYYSNANSQIFLSEKISFSTIAGCSGPLPAPTAGPNPSSPSCTKALVTWPSFPNAGSSFKYRFYFRLSSATGYSVVALNDTFYYLNNLQLSAGYEFFYKAICASSGSAVSATSTMYTNCSTPKTGDNAPSGPITINGITYNNVDFRDLVAATEDGIPVDGEVHEVNLQSDNSLANTNNIQLYPNPTSDYVTVDYLAIPNVDAIVKLTSIDGKTIKSELMNTENAYLVGNTNKVRLRTKLDLRENQAGIYIVTVSQDGNKESKQLIVIK